MEKVILSNRDIVMLGIQPWDIEIGCNFKDIAFEISKLNRVLYINRPLDRITSITKRHDTKTKNRLNSINKGLGVLTEINQSLYIFNPQTILESINWLPPGIIYTHFNKLNNQRLAKEILIAIANLKFSDPILIIDNDFYNGLYLKEYLKVNFVVYYLRDFLLSQKYFSKHGMVSEPEILRKVDLVATNSLYLSEYAQKFNSNTFDIGQGCEIEQFEIKPGFIPIDISSISNPIIGYCGALSSLRLNLQLLFELAEINSKYNFVFIGTEDKDFKKSALHNLANVYFLGHKEPSELPTYIHCFDVCINPQIVNDMTIGNYPRKIDEYLAAGKPVVATSTHGMQQFKDFTFLCNTLEEFTNAIELALSISTNLEEQHKRVEFARSHTWENSVKKLYLAIDKLNKN